MNRIKHKLNDKVRLIINRKNQSRLKNRDFSLICNNCNGAFILHDLGMRFNTPFVNLWMKPKDYIKMLFDLKGYMEEDMTFVTEENIDYPIGQIKDVRVYFQHYRNNEEAAQKWNERKKRINYDNLFVLLVDKDGCTQNDLICFEQLNFHNKVIFTNKPHPELKSAFYIKGFEDKESIGDCFAFVPNRIGKKYYDQFNYVKWFNHALNKSEV